MLFVPFFCLAKENKDPWTGKYPMSFITKTRTANTVGKGHLSVSLKFQDVENDTMMVNGDYQDLSSADRFDQYKMVFCAKYGWAKNHHIALGVPYIWTNFESPKTDIQSNGLGNVFIFEKWTFIEETRMTPAVAADVWYFFPNGDSDKKLGSDDDSVKLAFELSKAWKHFNLHVNPAYQWNLRGGTNIGEINAGAYINISQTTKLAVEYNFTNKEGKGRCHDLVPGILWKPSKASSIKLGVVINVDSTMKYRDDIGFCAKAFYKF